MPGIFDFELEEACEPEDAEEEDLSIELRKFPAKAEKKLSLAPCPFCGGKSVEIERIIPGEGDWLTSPFYRVVCQNDDCGALGPAVRCIDDKKPHEAQRKAGAMWNSAPRR